MIDVLYPILGGMVTRYVTNVFRELLEKINRKMEERLSFRSLRRKLKARLTGVSETELMFEESFQARILSVFVIHKETGLLIAESTWGETEIDDPHMVASMASAIKDFINDWIRRGGEASEVQLVSYGTSTLYIESAGSVYLVAFLDQEPDYEQRDRINDFFGGLVERYRRFFQRFDGDGSAPEIPRITEEINAFIHPENQLSELSRSARKKSSLPWSKILVGGVMLLIAVMLGLYGWREYRLYRWERRIADATGVRPTLEYEGDRIAVRGTLRDLKSYEKVRRFLDRNFTLGYLDCLRVPPSVLQNEHRKILERLRLRNGEIEKTERRVNELNTALARLQNPVRRDREELERLTKRLQRERREILEKLLEESQKLEEAEKKIERLFGTMRERQRKLERQERQIEELKRNWKTLLMQHDGTERNSSGNKPVSALRPADYDGLIREKLSMAFRGDPHFHFEDGTYDFANRGIFDKGSADPHSDSLVRIRKVFEKYFSVLMGDPSIRPHVKAIVIQGYTDRQGDPEFNRELSAARAESVRRYLNSLPFVKHFGADQIVISRGMGSADPVIIDGREDPGASRRIKIGYCLNESVRSKSIKDVLK